jgi:hypothetical protein
MFERLFLADWTALVTLIAFATALSVYGTIFYRTVRMTPPQRDRLARMPLDDEPTARHHDPR